MARRSWLPVLGSDDAELRRRAAPRARRSVRAAGASTRRRAAGTTILAFKKHARLAHRPTVDLLAVSAKRSSASPASFYGDVNKPKFDENETEEQLKKHDEEMKAARKNTQTTIQWSLIALVPLLLLSVRASLRWRHARCASPQCCPLALASPKIPMERQNTSKSSSVAQCS